MTAGVSGADLDELARLATRIERSAARLATVTNAASADVSALNRIWDGPDAAQFRQAWLNTHRPRLNRAVQELHDAAATIERNRQAQEFTSAADGTGLGALLPLAAALNGDGRWPQVQSLGGDALDFIFGDIGNFWNGGDQGFPVGSAAAAILKLNRIAMHAFGEGSLPVFNTGYVGRNLAKLLAARSGNLGAIGAWMQTPGANNAFKALGVAGGVVSTGLGLYDLYQQGNPIDAFQENGAGYVADVAGTAFSASTTAFLLAPNPVTGALALGTGAVWLGAEVVDNWDEITEWTSAAWDTGSEFASDVWNGYNDFVGDIGDGAVDVLDSAWDAGTGFVGGTISSIGDWF
jgi:uncharacterized protein YukE